MEPTESKRDEIALHIGVMIRVILVMELWGVEIFAVEEGFELLISIGGTAELGECQDIESEVREVFVRFSEEVEGPRVADFVED